MNSRRENSSPLVLVIEDDHSVRRMLRFSLRDAGFAIAEVTSGREALDHLERQMPEAVILDLGLPDQLAGAVLAWLRNAASGPMGRPAWVVISAMDLDIVVSQYGPLSSNFLPKPFDPWDLVFKLQELLDC